MGYFRTSFLVILALLSACGRSEKSATVAANSATVAPASTTPVAPKIEGPTVENGAGLLEAFQVAFGAPAPYLVSIPPEYPNNPSGPHQLAFSPVAFIHIAPDMVALVSKGSGDTTNYDCHACVGAMMIHYLHVKNSEYKLLGHWNIDAGATSYGTIAPWYVRTDIDNSPTLVIQNGYIGMGCENENDTFVALTPTGPQVQVDFMLNASYEDGSDTPDRSKEYKYKGTITPQQAGKSFVVNYTGTKTFSKTYTKLQDGKFYPAVDSQSDVPGC